MENYVNYLYQQILVCKQDLGLNVDIQVANEQQYVKRKTYASNTIYVVVKFLTATLDSGVKNQPIQLVILSEENQLDNAQMLFNSLAARINLTEIVLDNAKIKQTINSPVVMSNFVEIGSGKRSLMYMTGELIIIDGSIDVSNLTIQVGAISTRIRPDSFSYSYQMQPNTEQHANDPLAKSEKSSAVVSVGMIIPLASEESNYNAIIESLLKESGGKKSGVTQDGNTPYQLTFELFGVNFEYEMKLTSLNFSTGRRNQPALQVGFTR